MSTRPFSAPWCWLVALAIAAPACKSPESGATAAPEVGSPEGSAASAATPEDSDGSGQGAEAPPDTGQLPLPGFVQSTLRQEELRGIAMSSIQRGDTNRAVAALISLMETPEMSDLKASGVLLLAEVYDSEGNSDRALAILRQLLIDAPPMAELEFVYGRTLNELGRGVEAETHLRRAIALNPGFLQSYILLGSVLVADGRPDEAAPVYAAYETALAAVLAQLADTAQPLPDRLLAADALSMATPDSRITEALMALLSEDNVAIQATAIQVLAQVGTNEAVPALQAYAGRATHEELRDAATQAAQLLASQHPE